MAVLYLTDTECDEIRVLVDLRLTADELPNDLIRGQTVGSAAEDAIVSVWAY